MIFNNPVKIYKNNGDNGIQELYQQMESLKSKQTDICYHFWYDNETKDLLVLEKYILIKKLQTYWLKHKEIKISFSQSTIFNSFCLKMTLNLLLFNDIENHVIVLCLVLDSIILMWLSSTIQKHTIIKGTVNTILLWYKLSRVDSWWEFFFNSILFSGRYSKLRSEY